MFPVTILPAAENDLLDLTEYFDVNGGDDLGDRFLAACHSAFERLAGFPESGARLRLRHRRLQGFRFILTPGFENILILYTTEKTCVRVVRVLHGKRDIEVILGREQGDDLRH